MATKISGNNKVFGLVEAEFQHANLPLELCRVNMPLKSSTPAYFGGIIMIIT